VLQRADPADAEPDAAAIVAALDGVEASRVLVVEGVNGAVAIIWLKG